MEVIHAFPTNDEKEHYLECLPESIEAGRPFCGCICRPTYQEVGDEIQGIIGVIVVHNSFDGREGVEWAKEILHRSE
jgi:hypothetical protein